MPRIPEGEEVARLVKLYGEVEGWNRWHERQADREFIAPLLARGISMKNICKELAKMRCPELCGGRRW